MLDQGQTKALKESGAPDDRGLPRSLSQLFEMYDQGRLECYSLAEILQLARKLHVMEEEEGAERRFMWEVAKAIKIMVVVFDKSFFEYLWLCACRRSRSTRKMRRLLEKRAEIAKAVSELLATLTRVCRMTR